jgi:dCTP deaminase
MILPDHELRRIAEAGAVDPYDPEMVQPASIDLRLGTSFRVYDRNSVTAIDLGDPPDGDAIMTEVRVDEGDPFVLHPGEFALGSTWERITVPVDLAMYIDGKSSLGRYALAVHITAGYFDPGFSGVGTLELANFAPVPIVLRPGLPICQSRWMRLASPPDRAYEGRYQGDTGAAPSRYGRRR